MQRWVIGCLIIMMLGMRVVILSTCCQHAAVGC
jgi:hypothetical protein